MSRTKAKRDGQVIHDLQMKLHQEKLKNRVNNAKANDRNQVGFKRCVELEKQLVMAIINPESVSGFRYPDTYTEGTSCYQAINNFFVPVKQSTTPGILNYPNGSYYFEVHPEIENNVRYLDETDHTVTPEAISGQVTGSYMETSNLYGLYKGDGERKGASFVLSSATQTFDVVLPMADESGVPQPPIYTSEGIPGYYYLPCNKDNGAVSSASAFRIVFVVGAASATPSVEWVLEQVANDGSILATANGTTTTVGVQSLSLSLNSTAPQSPSNLLSWKIRVTLKATGGHYAAVYINELQMVYWSDIIKYKSEALPDLIQLKRDVEKYRVTAQSALLTYYGSNLTNGGFATCILYRGGIPAQMAGLYDYSSISEHPYSYDGPLREGTYGYWEGMDSTDYSFRTVMSNELYKRPYLIGTGTYAGDPATGTIDQPNILRGRMITHFEFTTRSQVYDVKPSPACILALQEGMRVISGVPNVMENGKHLAKLRRIASKAGKTLVALGTFAWQHKAEIEALAAAAPAILV